MKVENNFCTKLLKSSINNTPWVLLITTVLLVAAIIGGKNLYFRGDYNIFFDGSNPQLQAFEEIQATFNKTDNLAIVIAPADDNVFNEEILELVKALTEDAWQVPFSSRVDSLSNYQHTEAFEDDLIPLSETADFTSIGSESAIFLILFILSGVNS